MLCSLHVVGSSVQMQGVNRVLKLLLARPHLNHIKAVQTSRRSFGLPSVKLRAELRAACRGLGASSQNRSPRYLRLNLGLCELRAALCSYIEAIVSNDLPLNDALQHGHILISAYVKFGSLVNTQTRNSRLRMTSPSQVEQWEISHGAHTIC